MKNETTMAGHPEHVDPQPLPVGFEGYAQELVDIRGMAERGELVGIQVKDRREPAIAGALAALASEHGVHLRAPLHVDANGEFSLVALKMHADGGPLNPDFYGSAPFGETFAALLNRHGPRTGSPGPNVLDASNGWCKLNHFAAERLVLEEHARRQPQQHAVERGG